MSAYEQKRQQRIERLKDRAARLARASAAAHERARSIADMIPMGQPILVGHHSQRRHERDIARITSGYERAARLADEAAATLRRVRAAETNAAISSDDPDAIAKLRAKLDALEGVRARMVAANKAVRSRDPRTALAALGFSTPLVDELLTPDFAGRLGFPPFRLQNAAGKCTRLRKRIEALEARATAPAPAAVPFEGGRIEEAENRVRVVFEARPSREMCATLRSAGFRWAPSVGAWQRHASPGAWYAARRAVGVMDRGAA